jgi:hypothetical protein
MEAIAVPNARDPAVAGWEPLTVPTAGPASAIAISAIGQRRLRLLGHYERVGPSPLRVGV